MILYKATIIKDNRTRKREVKAQNKDEACQKLVNYYDRIKVVDIEWIGGII